LSTGLKTIVNCSEDNCQLLIYREDNFTSEDNCTTVPSDSSRICNLHFITGRPSDNPEDPDFVPSKFPTKDEKDHESSDEESENEEKCCDQHISYYQCCVPGCNSKRDSKKSKTEKSKIPFFFMIRKRGAPVEKWAKAIGRKCEHGSEWKPEKHHRICGLHFYSGKYSSDPQDQDYVPSWFQNKGVKQLNVKLSKKPFVDLEEKSENISSRPESPEDHEFNRRVKFLKEDIEQSSNFKDGLFKPEPFIDRKPE